MADGKRICPICEILTAGSRAELAQHLVNVHHLTFGKALDAANASLPIPDPRDVIIKELVEACKAALADAGEDGYGTLSQSTILDLVHAKAHAEARRG